MEQGEGVIKRLHSIWKGKKSPFLGRLPIFGTFSPHLWASLQRLFICSANNRGRSPVSPEPRSSTWNDGWWDYSKNIDPLSAETVSRSSVLLVFLFLFRESTVPPGSKWRWDGKWANWALMETWLKRMNLFFLVVFLLVEIFVETFLLDF